MKKRVRGGDPQKQRYWEAVVRRWREAGQSVRAFCSAEGLRESAFYFWRRELATADLMILFARFCKLPDDQMRHIMEYAESGRPIIGIRGSMGLEDKIAPRSNVDLVGEFQPTPLGKGSANRVKPADHAMPK